MHILIGCSYAVLSVNAVVNANQSNLRGCSMFVTLFPCNECAKLIIQARLARVVFLSDKHHTDAKYVAARRMFDLAGVCYEPYRGARSQFLLDFERVAKHKVLHSGDAPAVEIGTKSHTPATGTDAATPDGVLFDQPTAVAQSVPPAAAAGPSTVRVPHPAAAAVSTSAVASRAARRARL